MVIQKLSKTLMLALMLSCLIACGSRTVQSSQTILIVPPDALLTSCSYVKPPEVKLVPMTKAYIAQTINIGKCDNKVKAMREWKAKQMEIYK